MLFKEKKKPLFCYFHPVMFTYIPHQFRKNAIVVPWIRTVRLYYKVCFWLALRKYHREVCISRYYTGSSWYTSPPVHYDKLQEVGIQNTSMNLNIWTIILDQTITFQTQCSLSDSVYYGGCLRKEYKNMTNTDCLLPLHISKSSDTQQIQHFMSHIFHLECNAQQPLINLFSTYSFWKYLSFFTSTMLHSGGPNLVLQGTNTFSAVCLLLLTQYN